MTKRTDILFDSGTTTDVDYDFQFIISCSAVDSVWVWVYVLYMYVSDQTIYSSITYGIMYAFTEDWLIDWKKINSAINICG